MTDLDKQIESLIAERNQFEAENLALKAQFNEAGHLLNNLNNHPIPPEYIDYELGEAVELFLSKNPKQCLNSVKADAINDFINDVANMEVKGSKGTNHAEYYKAALRNVFLCGTHVVTKLRG